MDQCIFFDFEYGKQEGAKI